MQDYYDVQPDEVYILGKHYTRGRGGAQIQFITRHHLMYIGDGKAVVDRIWNTRAASAHYVIDPNGKTTQTVWDGNTAWANASQWANQRTIAIEHSNNTGRHPGGTDYHDKSWNISDKTLIAGARLAAALCLHYKLGRPTKRHAGDGLQIASQNCHGQLLARCCRRGFVAPGPRPVDVTGDVLHRQDGDIDELKAYFGTVFDWVSSRFPGAPRKQMQGLPWGSFYQKWGQDSYDSVATAKRVEELFKDPAIKAKKNIYEFILGGKN